MTTAIPRTEEKGVPQTTGTDPLQEVMRRLSTLSLEDRRSDEVARRTICIENDHLASLGLTPLSQIATLLPFMNQTSFSLACKLGRAAVREARIAQLDLLRRNEVAFNCFRDELQGLDGDLTVLSHQQVATFFYSTVKKMTTHVARIVRKVKHDLCEIKRPDQFITFLEDGSLINSMIVRDFTVISPFGSKPVAMKALLHSPESGGTLLDASEVGVRPSSVVESKVSKFVALVEMIRSTIAQVERKPSLTVAEYRTLAAKIRKTLNDADILGYIRSIEAVRFFPSEFTKCPHLERITIFEYLNVGPIFPTDVSHLQSVKYVKLEASPTCMHVPRAVAQLPNLQELELDGRGLVLLPRELQAVNGGTVRVRVLAGDHLLRMKVGKDEFLVKEVPKDCFY